MPNPEELMQAALQAAKKATRKVRPNPRVGACLISSDGQLVTGFHAECGGPHAEVALFEEAKRKGISTKDAAMAVTLEPCCHHGKTGPCVEAIIAAGVSDLFVGIEDPSEKVNGKGIAALEAAGVRTYTGILEDECVELNREWLFAQRFGRPWITVKMATSLDGRWQAQNGESRWITGEEARNEGHKLRSRVDGIVTSMATIRADNPRYTARPENFPLDDQPHIFVASQSGPQDLSQFKIADRSPEFLDTSLGLEATFKKLFQRDECVDLMLEAGPSLSREFLEQGCFEEIWLFLGMRFLGGDKGFAGILDKALPGLEVELSEIRLLGEDILLILKRIGL